MVSIVIIRIVANIQEALRMQSEEDNKQRKILQLVDKSLAFYSELPGDKYNFL